MPYFVYRIESRPIRKLSKLECFPSFREASAHAKAARAVLPEGTAIRVIFAENELHAEDLLSTVREAQKTGEDD